MNANNKRFERTVWYCWCGCRFAKQTIKLSAQNNTSSCKTICTANCVSLCSRYQINLQFTRACFVLKFSLSTPKNGFVKVHGKNGFTETLKNLIKCTVKNKMFKLKLIFYSKTYSDLSDTCKNVKIIIFV